MEPEIKVQQDTEYRTKQEMVARAEEDKKRGIQSEVYEWEFPKVLDAPIPMQSVAALVNKLRQASLKLAAKYPSWDNDKLRGYLRRRDPEFEDMAARTHPHLFTMIVDRNLTPKNFKRIEDLMAIRYMHEQSPDVEANTKLVSAYFNQEFYHGPKK